MELSKNYVPQATEQKWYDYWNTKGYFHSVPDERPAYTIVMPPPNVTGVLHMGHALNNTVQDILLRRARMQGYNTCWVPGTDHASIATEAKVVNMLREMGIDKNKLSREEFLKYAWEWKEKYGGIILQQLKKLGCSLDWERTHFTMDEGYYKAVINVFVDLYRKGNIYRGVKMINWDPQALTALSDEEVIHKETNSKLTYVRYRIDSDTEEYITIATVRPETILGDTAVCVHPDDERYAHLKGKYCFVPLINRRIPIIFDDYIDKEFGTGALKVTPAHDINDYNLGQKHNLEVIDTLNANGTLSEAAQLYIGEDRFAVRKKIVEDLKTSGNFVKQEDYTNQVGVSERTNAVIEPRLSMQWWCNMDRMAQPALEAVMNDDIRFYPSKFKNLYRHWMSNIKDWCISRQLWWGQRIPAWYDKQGNIYVAPTEAEAKAAYKAAFPDGADELRQEEDVFDTWFSAWLWPMEVFDWDKDHNNKELAYYYPTSTLVTAPDIIFFWVARMIMSGYEYQGKLPFEQVYFTGLIRDKQGRKMSKQLGNSPDLLQLIEDYGADIVRFSVLISSPAGNDILYDESFLEQGRNFSNKIWNALKLVKMWEEKTTQEGLSNSQDGAFATSWMHNRILEARTQIDHMFRDFKLSEALKTIYSLIWDDFCSWYLEWVKPAQDQAMSREVYEKTLSLFEDLLQLLHPYMPFLTEEVFHLLREQQEDLINRQLPAASAADDQVLRQGALLQQLISAIRDTRNKNQLKPKETVSVAIDTANTGFYTAAGHILQRQVNADSLEMATEAPAGWIALVVQTEKVYLDCKIEVDPEAQRGKMQEELEYLKGFLLSVDKKLSNERFVQNAKPEIIENERKKQSDAVAKIKTLEESLSLL
ncbi:valine--tRNA ligase [Taibaiella chishuiensis]|uniref:Valine--tRNA ligase n=1 Tax=Taibaiella chishuiensis TaxID=1434707 RepID=A0A2P8D0H0_9BACT|nr:valine--tRNA ligase [Taibaiella chishuiensis]PSK90707.1 valyl-tRNA synthetase [Taibaiella chishuiensis]